MSYEKSHILLVLHQMQIRSIYNFKVKEESAKAASEVSAHTGYLSCCRFISDRQLLRVMRRMLWNIDAGMKTLEFTDHTGDVMSLPRSLDKNIFVSGAYDATAKVWDILTARCVQTFTGHESDINAVQ